MAGEDSDGHGQHFLLEKAEDLGEDSEGVGEEQINISQLFIIDHRGAFSIFWTGVDTALCLLSSYIYMWFGAFNDAESHDLHVTATVCFEVTFLLLMLKKFLTSYSNQGEAKPVRNLHQIAMRYLQGEFIRDLIPLLPVTFIFDGERRMVKLLYVIKVVRVLNGFKVFDTHKIYQSLHLRSQERLR